MSHFTKIKTKLYNLEILKKSLDDLSLSTTLGNTEVRGYKNQKHIAELVIKQSNNMQSSHTRQVTSPPPRLGFQCSQPHLSPQYVWL